MNFGFWCIFPFVSKQGVVPKLQVGNFGKVYLADNKALEIEGKGDVCIKTTSGNQWTLEDVRYIPGIKKNLISVGQLDSTGYAQSLGKVRGRS